MKSVLLLSCLSLSGCASLWYAGESDYRVTLDNGVAIEIHSGKEEQAVDATFTQTPTGYVIALKETGVEAFKGQAVAASAASDVAAAAAAAAITALKTIK